MADPIEADPTMRVLRSLADQSHDFRTIEGIAREQELAEDIVGTIVSELVELNVARTPLSGEEALFTLAARRPSARERWSRRRGDIATW